jgi:hypothetical protein
MPTSQTSDVQAFLWAMVLNNWRAALRDGKVEEVRRSMEEFAEGFEKRSKETFGPVCPHCHGSGLLPTLTDTAK